MVGFDFSFDYWVAGTRVLDNEYKLKLNIRIAMLYLEDDDSVNAELFIKRASALIASCKVENLWLWLEDHPSFPFLTLIVCLIVCIVNEINTKLHELKNALQ